MWGAGLFPRLGDAPWKRRLGKPCALRGTEAHPWSAVWGSHAPYETRKHTPGVPFGEALRPYEARKHTPVARLGKPCALRGTEAHLHYVIGAAVYTKTLRQRPLWTPQTARGRTQTEFGVGCRWKKWGAPLGGPIFSSRQDPRFSYVRPRRPIRGPEGFFR
jgi:hypothetical protein